MIDLPDQAFLLNTAARGVQWGFLAAIVVAVITGYLLPWSQGIPLDVFGLAISSPIASSRGFHELMEEVHDVSGHLFIPLLALSLPFIPSIAETLEFCITTGYPFRHA